MAFTGAATVEKITDSLVRITGLSLAGGAAGTIGLFGDATADENLPDDFNPVAYENVTLVDGIQCWAIPTGAPAAGVHDIAISKAAGPFQITITNNDGVNASAALEIWVRWH